MLSWGEVDRSDSLAEFNSMAGSVEIESVKINVPEVFCSIERPSRYCVKFKREVKQNKSFFGIQCYPRISKSFFAS